MVQKDPDQRISLTNILTHKFIIKHYLEEQKLTNSNSNEIIKIKPKNKDDSSKKVLRKHNWKKSLTGSPIH